MAFIRQPPAGFNPIRGALLLDGSKVERDLRISYTPIQVAPEEAIGDVTKQDAQGYESLLETGSR
jgi:hypothetical protein